MIESALTKLLESKAGQSASTVLGKMGGSFVADILQYSKWGLNIKMKLLKNQIDAAEEVKKICKQKGIRIKQVNTKALLPWLEGVAVEEEPRLKKLWTNLMANYMASKKNLMSHVYPQILKQLSTDEVILLARACDTGTITIHNYVGDFTVINDSSEISNLVRMGLVDQELQIEGTGRGGLGFGLDIKEVYSGNYHLTIFAFEFLTAVSVLDKYGNVKMRFRKTSKKNK
jgi:hypothetical protein